MVLENILKDIVINWLDIYNVTTDSAEEFSVYKVRLQIPLLKKTDFNNINLIENDDDKIN